LKKILVLALALQACALAGTVTYTYTGNPFTNCQVGDCSSLTRVTATLEFADPLAPSTSYTWGPTGQPGVALSPLVWLMSNGQDTVAPLFTDPVGANSSVIFLITDSIGQIATWVVQGADPAYGGPSVKLTTSTVTASPSTMTMRRRWESPALRTATSVLSTTRPAPGR
jgi:hypothetical protein